MSAAMAARQRAVLDHILQADQQVRFATDLGSLPAIEESLLLSARRLNTISTGRRSDGAHLADTEPRAT